MSRILTSQTSGVPSRQRAHGEVRATFSRAGARTEASRSFETGGLRLRFPRSGAQCECVIVNTGGGMAGGDTAKVGMTVEVAGSALVTTQAAEKIYRADGTRTSAIVSLEVDARATLVWAPQETLLFQGADFSRRLEADVGLDASLLIVESAVFGRLAHGETRIDAAFEDTWRVRRGGKLIFAETLKITDAGAQLERPAVGAGARAIATVLKIGGDALTALDAVRVAIEDPLDTVGERLDAGVSALDGVLVVRLASPSPPRLRAGVIAAMRVLRNCEAPRVWA